MAKKSKKGDAYKEGGKPAKTSSGKSGKSGGGKKGKKSSKASRTIEADADKKVWYSDRGKTSKKDIKARQDLHLAGKFPAVAGHWCLGEFQNAKGVVFLIIAHSGGVQVALKERNAGEFFWRSPMEPRRKKGEEPGGVQVQPSGHRSNVTASSNMMPEVVDFDRVVAAATEQGAAPTTLGKEKRYKYGRFGFWFVELSTNGTLQVTNSNKAVKDTAYQLHLERFGALRFTDVGGGDHALADQDELERQKKKAADARDGAGAKRARAEKKRNEQMKRQGGGTHKLGKAGAAEEEGDVKHAWTCEVCSTRGNLGDICKTCRRPRGQESSKAADRGKRGR